jgi:hypothetical protein
LIIAVVFHSWAFALIFFCGPVTSIAMSPKGTRKALIRGILHGSEERREDCEPTV